MSSPGCSPTVRKETSPHRVAGLAAPADRDSGARCRLRRGLGGRGAAERWRPGGHRGRCGRRASMRGLPFSLYDGVNLPFPDGRFDVAMLSFVLHHVPNERKVVLLREALRVARQTVFILEDTPTTAFDRFVSRRHGEAYRREIASDAPVRLPDPQRVDVAVPRHGRRGRKPAARAVLPIGAAAVRARRVRAPQAAASRAGAGSIFFLLKPHSRARTGAADDVVVNARRCRRRARCRGQMTAGQRPFGAGAWVAIWSCRERAHARCTPKADAADVGDADFAALIEAVYSPGGRRRRLVATDRRLRPAGLDRGQGLVGCLFVRRGRRNAGDDGGGRRGSLPADPKRWRPRSSPRLPGARPAPGGTIRVRDRARRGCGAGARQCSGIVAAVGRAGAPARAGCALLAPLPRAEGLSRDAAPSGRGWPNTSAPRCNCVAPLARGRRSGGGLLSGRWQLVDHFDAGGRRFVIARGKPAPRRAARPSSA